MDFANINLSPITWVVFTLFIFSGTTLYLVYQTRNAEIFSRVLLFTTGFLFVHCLYIAILSAFFSNAPWKYLLAPFGLVYGPILFFNITVARVRKISYWQVILHAIPFLLFLIFYISLLLYIIPHSVHTISLGKKYLGYASTSSFIGYSIWTFTIEKQVIYNRLKQKVLLLVLGQILLILVSIFSFIFAFTSSLQRSDEALVFVRLLTYTCLFLCLLVIFHYSYNKRVQINSSVKGKGGANKRKVLPKYERSALSSLDLDRYEKKLRAIMSQDKLYLQKNLSLAALAHHLKMPTHHLTHVLSHRFHVTFHQYINSLRIEHACTLIEQSGAPLSVADLADLSGFNSLVTFNRQFKAITNSTPSTFRQNISN